MNDEVDEAWKGEVVVYSRDYSAICSVGLRKITKKSGEPASLPIFEPSTSRKRVNYRGKRVFYAYFPYFQKIKKAYEITMLSVCL
jgi:hypothetical protein